mgnify:FL=1
MVADDSLPPPPPLLLFAFALVLPTARQTDAGVDVTNNDGLKYGVKKTNEETKSVARGNTQDGDGGNKWPSSML